VLNFAILSRVDFHEAMKNDPRYQEEMEKAKKLFTPMK